jgi:undecaprenyl-diphosphatase
MSLDSAMHWLSNWGVIVPIACVLLSRDKKIILRGLVALVLTFFITDVLKIIIARPRPNAIGSSWFLSTPADVYSFPSKHASTAFSLATSVILHRKVLGWIAAIFAVLIAVSRIYLGAHYWSDILAGAVLGILISFATDKAARYFEKGKKSKQRKS